MAPDLARTAVHFHPEVKKPSIEVNVEDMTVNRSRAYLKIHGILYHKPVDGDLHGRNHLAQGAVRPVQPDQRQLLRRGGAGPGGRKDPEPVTRVQRLRRLPSRSRISLQSGGERLSFISEMNEIHDGLDIIVGSQHIGSMISQGITAQLGGRYTTHPKLVGEKNGRQLFRITYSVRLPRFQKHDVVVVEGRYFEIGQVDSRHVRVLDLADGT